MRIIAGTHRSRRFDAPQGRNTRPTLDRVRENIFNMIQGDVASSRVLDLFAGSGALSLEALSRGADFAVMEQLEKLSRRQVWLPSGGFVVVDPCEALTAIDVNTGKSVGKGGDKEQLFLRTNLEAADMIARILRVRGIGGIVIIDLIDMETDAARETVLARFRALLKDDPVKCVVHGFTSLGLLEMTRKKTGR